MPAIDLRYRQSRQSGCTALGFTSIDKMNRIVIVVALILACIFSCYGLSPDMKAAVDECKNQHNLDSDQIKTAFDKKEIPETAHGKCFMSCVMEKMGVLKDGKIDLDRILEINRKKFKDPENLGKADEIANRCANVESPDSEECSLATELAKCALKNAIELKLEVPKDEI
ncbi:unnamed protein product [Nezara viridula]|uniref:Uncharacterized protein n=1 Tax=Nezara viridula TaxID=85310 RepID=A0A9P0E7I1_NEZVI|nr:unnamed protein product [Nezara viridula]